MNGPEELIHLSHVVHRGWAQSDVVALEPLIAASYHHVDIFGRVYDRETWLRYVEQPREVSDIEVQDPMASIVGDVGVVTSTLVGVSREIGDVRLLQVWLRSDVGWRRAWYQATRLSVGHDQARITG